MKNIFESSKVFQAYARIDYCYYAIRVLEKQSKNPISPMERAIDIACKFNPTKETTNAIIHLMREVIRSKKIVEADYSGDEKAIKELLKVKKSYSAKPSK